MSMKSPRPREGIRYGQRNRVEATDEDAQDHEGLLAPPGPRHIGCWEATNGDNKVSITRQIAVKQSY